MPKCLIEQSDGSYVSCQPEKLSSYPGTLVAIGALYYFGGDREYVYVYYPIGDPECFWVEIDADDYVVCQDLHPSDDDEVSIVIDDFGNTFSLSEIKHLPIIFEYMMVLPRDVSAQEVHEVFKAHYYEND